MKVFKGVIVIVILMFSLIAFCINVLQNTRPYSYLGEIYPGPYFRPIKWYSINNFFDHKAYGFNKPSSKDAILADFSDNDIRYNDSIIDLMTIPEHYIDDDLKEWKKSHLIYKGKRYKIKYKFHGSHNYNYKQGKISLKLRSKKTINEAKQFSLISGYQEASFINIFLALQEHKGKLIAPDPGSILLANLNGKVEDFWFTEDMSNDYLKYKYGLESFKIFEVSDNWMRNGGAHFSELDGFYYYLDGDNSEQDSENYNKYKVFIESINNNEKSDHFPNTDYEYMGRFLANLYFFYDAHHIQGDNNKYLFDYSNNLVYPVARNEGVYEKINNILNLDQGIFDTRKSPTAIFYKKAVCNDSIKFYRDLELYRLVKNRDRTLYELDSIKSKYNNYHKYYNVAYMNVRYKYKKIRDVIIHNSNAFLKYLENGEVAIAYDKKNKKIKIATDYRVPLKVIDIKSSESFIFKGVEFKYKDGVIKAGLIENEYTFKDSINKSQLKIVNMITKDTVPNSNIIFNYY
ncbi:hypothetical protein QWY87_13765 [Lutimonas halocynthiae]|uniref:hypothetical protein n=1 Tax=Lutimonas halocynthiae TaxID=1446477 RepID=UPI0025B3A699|nr:hypothetical protein [Lutimonas halocynthiae]MDN3643779.1 hypothetical protein [Lutimonas halocynthiae]